MKQLLEAIGIVVTRDIKRRIRDGKITPHSKNSGTTLVKFGKLVNSITHVVSGNHVIVGTNLKYARILHEGGTIRPVKAKYLAIPLTKEAAVRKPRDWQGTFIRKGIIFRSLEGGKIDTLYALKTQVVIPARPYMYISEDTSSRLRNLINSYLDKNLTGGQ